MPTNFTTFQNQFFNAVAASSLAADWITEFPLAIDRAEQRCYRDLDMLSTRTVVVSYGSSMGGGLVLGKLQAIPSSTSPSYIATVASLIAYTPPFIAVEDISVTNIASAPSTGPVTALIRASPQFISICWPSESPPSTPSVPQYYAMISNTAFVVGPPPDQRYTFQVRGPVRPTPLSSANSSTPLTMQYPDLFFASAMIEAGTYMRFIEPQMAVTWAAEYMLLKQSALLEEMRSRSWAEGWADKQPSPAATPPRA